MKINVTVPITGELNIELDVPEGTSKDDIYHAATEKWSDLPEEEQDQHVHWEFVMKTCYGNVCSLSCTEVEVTEV